MRKPTLEQVEELINLARASIKGEFFKTSYEGRYGVFVTLEKDGMLRGCVGIIQAGNVNDLVARAARSAAFHDSRFLPVKKEELDKIIIEISFLSKPEKCELDSVKKGDGVIINEGLNSALFLPQVWEQLPDKHDFLTSLAFKAGLSNYKNASFEKFSVISFKERTPNGVVFFES